MVWEREEIGAEGYRARIETTCEWWTEDGREIRSELGEFDGKLRYVLVTPLTWDQVTEMLATDDEEDR